MDFLNGKIKTLYFKYLAAAFGSALITSTLNDEIYEERRVCIKAFLTLCYTIDAVSLFCLWINQQISIDLYFTYVGQIRIIPFEDGEGSP